MHKALTRRALLRGGIIAGAMFPLAGLVARTAAAAARLPELDPADPAANAMGYVLKTQKPGETCANCAQYVGKARAVTGTCELFPDKRVVAAGWCSAWVKKVAP
jgi:hypothetical protein